MSFFKWPAKDPEEELDYQMDFSDWVSAGFNLDTAVAVVESGTLADGSAEVPPLLQVDLVTVDTNVVSVWLDEGTLGATYIVKVTVTDTNAVPYDREGVRRAQIKIKAK